MIFNSINFIIFFLIISFLYYLVPKKIQWIFLLVVSLIFYMYAGPKFIIFIVITTITTYYCAIFIEKKSENQQILNSNVDETDKNINIVRRHKSFILIIALIINIGILFFLKYYNYFINLGNSIFEIWDISTRFPTLTLILPLGISFYTLQAIGYCIDVYRNKYEPEKNIFKYALFLLFFPQILQGPIGRYDSLAAQIYKEKNFNYDNVKFGFQLMVFGFFKKLVIADRANILVNQVFDNYQSYSGYHIFLASLFYTLQIYADFSGCTDIARGAAQVLDINIMKNFDRPYFAKSIQDFWRRWHISLSSWFRDYLYFPLGGNRKGICGKCVNILIVFFVSGVWHGVGLHYIAWGLLHGIYQIIGIILMPFRNLIVKTFGINRQSFGHKLYKIMVTFSLVNFAWIFFRADGLRNALHMIKSIVLSIINRDPVYNVFYSMGLDATNFRIIVISIFVMIIVSSLQRKINIRETIAQQSFSFRWTLYFISVCSIIILGIYGETGTSSAFIYYKF
ncbi:MBOAT family protein [Clostridium chromiireducens]|uniref:MBOAT family protein n=1 Tax=Clostridium chromiireducens TaxID=225345 RepID=A0A399IWP2_9CLOT|nr:MBOAT family O-acyltransferase [Clostridium chromiireducens]RII36649.1 MBOAT family protein [Clostridium chromiireducens]